MRIFLFIFIGIISTNLYAISIVETYLTKGIKGVEFEIKKLIQDEGYWKGVLKDKDLEYGYHQSDKKLILVNKNKKIVKVYNYSNYKLNLDIEFNDEIKVGKSGDKQKEGDLRTPVGVYDLVKRLKPIDGFYGPVAHVLSYPNLLDTLDGKNGYGIWIHGFPLNGEDRDLNTKGCVAMDNEYLLSLDSFIKDKQSLVLISENEVPTTNVSEMAKILSQIFQWQQAWENSDIKKYLSFYHFTFKRYDGMKIKEFSQMKTRIFNKNENKKILFKDISITPYPNIDNLKIFRLKFIEDYIAPSYQFFGTKELYLLLENDKIKILVEK